MWDKQFEALLRHRLPLLSSGDELTAETNLREFGLDSMGAVELLSALEADYSVQFDEEALVLDTFNTPGALWAALSAARPAL
ncbi:Acyl carrier protein [Nonomuraea solani]|uniref:Acyl carrier protein n=1 Tax=Nonomuraea solani TaxID=1144553 RepID=A0A1H6F4G9_9ACTN|nr:acyl carrier protein [Nonomuraea solani]SEH03874.1 Acyl carrier protein [Nonomuraea solani]